jgi:hypothetical protein
MTTAVEFKKISPGATALLRRIRIAGGALRILDDFASDGPAVELKKAGYIQFKDEGNVLRLTGHGQAHLDRLMRAH